MWSVVFVEWWRVRERILSLRFGTRGSFRVEKRRVAYRQGQTWWGRELRILASLPVILLFAGILSALLTSIFVFEAFVTHLYQGPGKHLIVRRYLKPIWVSADDSVDFLSHYPFRRASAPSTCVIPGPRSSPHLLGEPCSSIKLQRLPHPQDIRTQRHCGIHVSWVERIRLCTIW